jgi:hypothetical protein
MKTLSNAVVFMPRWPSEVQRCSPEIDAEASDEAKDLAGAEDLRLPALLFSSFVMADDEPSEVDTDTSIL